jgi:hypothetical protein
LAEPIVTPVEVVIADEVATLTEVSRIVLSALERQARAGVNKSGGSLGKNKDGSARDLHDTGRLFDTADPGPEGVRFTVDYAHVLSQYDADGLSPEYQAEVEREISALLAVKVVAK